MPKFFFQSLRRGAGKLKDNPQLVYTIVVAFLIATSFVFISERFTGIANDAQERLINVRIGSLQDAFVSFAGDRLGDPAYLNAKIAEIIASNETIKSFQILAKDMDSFRVIASDKPEEIGATVQNISFLYNLATTDPGHSITIPFEVGGERFFQTARALSLPDGTVPAVAVSTQTLSLADQLIEKNIRDSRVILVLIVVVIMLLFLRLSKIIDYIDLYQKLKSVDQLKDDFISMASHELRTPLTTIRGYAEFMEAAPELTPATRDFSKKISISAKDLDTLVADILDVSRIEQGRLAFKMDRLDPMNTINEVVESLAIPAKEKGLALMVENKTSAPAFVSGDASRLRQVLVNLVGNAVKYTSKGEVKISTSAEKGRLFIRVSDTGFGMTEEERAKLFEKFYRVRNSETKEIRGTGLGLWITKKIVEEMKGKITVESIKGVWSHFIVSFNIIN